MGQKFFDPRNGMFGNAAENISEPGKRIDLDEFARGDEAAQYSRGLAAVVASEESPVVPTHGKTPQRSFGSVVVYGQIAIGTVACERRPVLQR